MVRGLSLPVLTSVGLLLVAGCTAPQANEVVLSISSDATTDWKDVPIIVEWDVIADRLGYNQHPVVSHTLGDTGIPSQVDDLDGDGEPDVLFLLVDLPATATVDLEVTGSRVPPTYPARTQALLSVRQGGRFDEDGRYVDGSEFVRIDRIEVPDKQEQDSDWARFEGPVWESDLVGYRYYLDDRYRTDIFGKRTADLVLHAVEGDYHAISDWGADILKVGGSLGLGSIAAVTDTGLALVDNAERRVVEIVASGPLRSIIRTTHQGWFVAENSVDLVAELEIHAGRRWTEQRLQLDGFPESRRLATGIVRHPEAPELHSGEAAGITYLYTWGPQADQGHVLGMAVLVPGDLSPRLDNSDPLSHVVTFDALGGAASYRYLAAWELEPDPVADRESFEEVVKEVASEWASSAEVKLK